MRGKLIIIDSGDGCGKATQSQALFMRLKEEHYQVKKVEYPDYKSNSSALVKMYLNGEFGSDPGDVNPYAASLFYTVDRVASYKKEWEDFYKNGGIVIADRYTTSNMIHQAAKITDAAEKDKYLEWLWDLEYQKCQLPVPDCVLFLDLPPEYSACLMNGRVHKSGERQDIHEENRLFVQQSYQNACAVAEKYKWYRISCVNGAGLRSIAEIHEDIYQIVTKVIGRK